MFRYFVVLIALFFSSLSFSGVYKCTENGGVVYTSSKKVGCLELKTTVGAYSKDDSQPSRRQQPSSSDDDGKKTLEEELNREKNAVSEINTQMKSEELSIKDVEAMRRQLDMHRDNIQKIARRLS